MELYIENTKGWCCKTILGIGREYDMHGDLDTIYIDLFIYRIGLWLK